MFRSLFEKFRRDPYDDAYVASRRRRLERERRAAQELGALRVFSHEVTGRLPQITTGSLPRMKRS